MILVLSLIVFVQFVEIFITFHKCRDLDTQITALNIRLRSLGREVK